MIVERFADDFHLAFEIKFRISLFNFGRRNAVFSEFFDVVFAQVVQDDFCGIICCLAHPEH